MGHNPYKKCIGKPSQWYFEHALAALAGVKSQFKVEFVRSICIRAGHVRVRQMCAVFCCRCGYFSLPVWTFSSEDSDALRAQAIYWNMTRKIGGKI